MKNWILFILALICPLIFIGQIYPGFEKSLKFVDPVYKGWKDNPDSVTVRIMPGPPEFSSEDSASIKKAIDMWNGTNSSPKLKLITSGTPQIPITRNDNIDGASGTTKANPDWVNYESCDVQIDTDDGQPVLGVVLHELGHCLGLNDTENKNDVMYGGADSVPLTFSGYDSTEVKDAAAVIMADKGIRESETPDRALVPGQVGILKFTVADIIPDSLYGIAQCVVASIDPGVYVENFYLEPALQSLFVNVFINPEHTNGQFYLNILIMLPDRPAPSIFLGTHCINILPVDPVSFECPMSIYEQDGLLHVDWVAGCTYPFGDHLRSRLLISSGDNSYGLQIRPDGDYILDLEPGEYTFTLQVNDFQVNTATSTQTYIITGIKDNPESAPLKIWPNPFTEKCSLSLKQSGKVRIFDLNGKLIYVNEGKELVWEPDKNINPGVYILQVITGDQIYTARIIYCK